MPGASKEKISSDADIKKRMMRFNNSGADDMLNPE
jgi:hypothetical protein